MSAFTLVSNFFFFSLFLIVLSYSHTRICETGDCVFDCSDGSCAGDTLICSNSADSCTVDCNGYQACRSLTPLRVYSGAKGDTTIYCSEKDSCIGAQFYCGSSESAPVSASKIVGNHGKCSIACGDVGCKLSQVKCVGSWSKGCFVNTTTTGSDNFKESFLECKLESGAQPCELQCANYDSCDKSVFLCKGGSCKCRGPFCYNQANPKIQTPAPALFPTHHPTRNTPIPSTQPSNSPTTTSPTRHPITTNSPTNVPTSRSQHPTQFPTTRMPTIPGQTWAPSKTPTTNPTLSSSSSAAATNIFQNRVVLYGATIGGGSFLCVLLCCTVYTLKSRYEKEEAREKLTTFSTGSVHSDHIHDIELDKRSAPLMNNSSSKTQQETAGCYGATVGDGTTFLYGNMKRKSVIKVDGKRSKQSHVEAESSLMDESIVSYEEQDPGKRRKRKNRRRCDSDTSNDGMMQSTSSNSRSSVSSNTGSTSGSDTNENHGAKDSSEGEMDEKDVEEITIGDLENGKEEEEEEEEQKSQDASTIVVDNNETLL